MFSPPFKDCKQGFQRVRVCLSSPQCQFNPCFPGVKCVNTAPGYRCEACPLGYSGLPVEGVGAVFAQTNKQVNKDQTNSSEF